MFSLFASSTFLTVCLTSFNLVNSRCLDYETLDWPFTTESIEYDAINDLYYIADFNNGILYYYDASNTEDFSTDKTPLGSFNNGNFGPLVTPTGMYSDVDTLYVNNLLTGTIVAFDIATKTATNSFTVNFDDDTPAGINGMCVDPTNPQYLYVTDAGLDTATGFATNTDFGMIYRVDLTDGSSIKVYDPVEQGYAINPNGCIFDQDGTFYSGEMKRDGSSKLIVWEPSKNEYQFVDLPGDNPQLDGIVVDNKGTIYYADWGGFATNTGSIYRVKVKKNKNKKCSLYKFKFKEIAGSDMFTPADMAINENEEVLIIPSVFSPTIYTVEL